MSEIFDSIIGFAGALALSIACAFNLKTRGFNMDIFLSAFCLGLCVLVFLNYLPIWCITFAVIIIVILLFKDREGT